MCTYVYVLTTYSSLQMLYTCVKITFSNIQHIDAKYLATYSSVIASMYS